MEEGRSRPSADQPQAARVPLGPAGRAAGAACTPAIRNAERNTSNLRFETVQIHSGVMPIFPQNVIKSARGIATVRSFTSGCIYMRSAV